MRNHALPCLVGILLILPAASLAEWVWRNPSTTSNTLTGLSQGGGRYVAVGKAGTVVLSPDGRAWEAVSTGLTVDLADVAYGGGKFVATGSHGTLAWSPDGRRWTWVGRPGAAFGYSGVAWSGNRFIAVSDSPGVPAAWSEDGVTWSGSDTADAGRHRIACTEGLCLAAGRQGNLAVTRDGARWERKASPRPEAYACGVGVAGGGLAAYCGGELFFTRDGDAWDPVNPLDFLPISDIAPWLGGWIAVGAENMPDNGGKEARFRWRDSAGIYRPIGPYFRGGMHAVLGDGDLALAAGDLGRIYAFGADASHSLAGRRVTGENLRAIAGSGSRLVAVGDNRTLLLGTDDSTWTPGQLPQAQDPYGGFLDVAWSGSRFVAVGEAGIATSRDGSEWTWIEAVSPYGYTGVVWTGGRFIATRYAGDAWISEEGTEWRRQIPLPPALGTGGLLAWTGTEALIVRQDTIRASRDGLDWETRIPRGLGNPRQVAGSNGILLALSIHSDLARSADGGRTWENTGIAGYPPPLRLLAMDSGFALVTRGAGGVGALTLHLSADGLAWTHVDIPMEHPPEGIHEHRGKLILVGVGGAVLSAAKADLPFSVGIRKTAMERRPARGAAPRKTRFSWQGRDFDAAGRSRPASPR